VRYVQQENRQEDKNQGWKKEVHEEDAQGRKAVNNPFKGE